MVELLSFIGQAEGVHTSELSTESEMESTTLEHILRFLATKYLFREDMRHAARDRRPN